MVGRGREAFRKNVVHRCYLCGWHMTPYTGGGSTSTGSTSPSQNVCQFGAVSMQHLHMSATTKASTAPNARRSQTIQGATVPIAFRLQSIQGGGLLAFLTSGARTPGWGRHGSTVHIHGVMLPLSCQPNVPCTIKQPFILRLGAPCPWFWGSPQIATYRPSSCATALYRRAGCSSLATCTITSIPPASFSNGSMEHISLWSQTMFTCSQVQVQVTDTGVFMDSYMARPYVNALSGGATYIHTSLFSFRMQILKRIIL